jgi:uncharacterized membrane protein
MMAATDIPPVLPGPTRRPTWVSTRTGPPARGGRWQRLWPHVALAAGLFAAHTLVSVLRYDRFGSPSWDLGIFTEAVKAYAHLQAPIVPIKGEGFNVLGDHFSPIIAVLAPLYRLFPSAIALLVAQAALFAWSAGVVSATAEGLLGRARGLCVGTAYGLSFGVQRAIDVEFHEIAFAAPLLAIVCRQLLARRWHRAAWWALPLLLVKEDLGLTVAAVGVLALLQGRRWRAGTILLVAGLAGSAVELWWVIPHFNPGGHFDYWTKLPSHRGHHDWWQMIWQPISRLQTWKTLGWTAGITGMLALRSPLLLLAAPTLAWRMLSTDPDYWGTDWHYSAVLMPIVFLAAADAAARFRRSRRVWLRQAADRALTSLPAIAVACCCALGYGIADLAQPGAWSGGESAAAREAALRVIPDGVRVEATQHMLTHLAARTDAYWIGGSKALPPQFIVLDQQDWEDLPQGQEGAAYGTRMHPGARYGVVFEWDGVTVLRVQS